MRRAVYTTVFTVVLCCLSAVTVTAAKLTWGPLEEMHKAGAKIGAIVEAFGLIGDASADPAGAIALYNEHVTRSEKKGKALYKAARDGEPLGHAIEVNGPGLEGPVEGILAVKPDRKTVIGFRIHHQEETPGLGARIAERAFLEQFAGRSIAGPDGEPGIKLVRKASAPNEVDAITGATLSSAALERMLKTRIAEFVSGRALAPITIELPRPLFAGTPTIPPDSTAEPPSGERRKPFMAPVGVTNVARGKPVAASEDPTIGELGMITDDNKDGGEDGLVEIGFDQQHVQIDLGAVYEIHAVVVWRDHAKAGIYRDVVVQVSDDAAFGTGVTAVFNNDQDNSAKLGAGTDREYVETYEGRLIPAKGVKGRYVRLTSAGSSVDEMCRFTEVAVYGLPASGADATGEGETE